MSAMTHCLVDDRFVEVPGGQVFVRQWTPDRVENDTPLVLLHDSLGCVQLWRQFPGDLAIRLRRPAVAYDRLGFGQSSVRSQLPSLRFIDEEAELIVPELCRALGLGSVVPFGHSVGGCMALAIASIHSRAGMARAVITESAQAFVEPRTTQRILAEKDQFRDPGRFAKLARFHGDKAQWVLDAWTETWLSPEFASSSLDAHLARVSCPTLVIHGDRDEYGSCEFPRRIAEGVQGISQLCILDSCGHVPHREQSEKVLDAVSGFLADVGH